MKGRLIHKDTNVFYGNIGEFACSYKGTNYYVGDTFMLEGEGNTIIVKDDNSEVFLMGYRGCTSNGNLSSIYHKIVRIKRYTDLSDGDIIDCIMVILENNESKQYYGDEILKMIREGKLKEGDRLLGRYNKFDKFDNKFTVEKFNDELVLLEVLSSDYRKEINYSQLLNMTFKIKEKEYLTFDEARKLKGKLCVKEDKNNIIQFDNIEKALLWLANTSCENEQYALDDKIWFVEV